MKKWLTFLIGFISGIVFTFIVALVISSSSNSNGMTFFEQPAKCLISRRFEVIQVIDNNYALAQESYDGLVVLITNDNGEYYYDEQTIEVPVGQCVRQVGIYKYQTKIGIEKTVPIVKLMDE